MSNVDQIFKTASNLRYKHTDNIKTSRCLSVHHSINSCLALTLNNNKASTIFHRSTLRYVLLTSVYDVTSNVASQRKKKKKKKKKKYRHSFCRPEKIIFVLQTLTCFTSFYLEQNSGHAYIKFVNIGLTIGSDLLPETYALTSKCHIPCYAKHHIHVVKRQYFRRA